MAIPLRSPSTTLVADESSPMGRRTSKSKMVMATVFSRINRFCPIHIDNSYIERKKRILEIISLIWNASPPRDIFLFRQKHAFLTFIVATIQTRSKQATLPCHTNANETTDRVARSALCIRSCIFHIPRIQGSASGSGAGGSSGGTPSSTCQMSMAIFHLLPSSHAFVHKT